MLQIRMPWLQHLKIRSLAKLFFFTNTEFPVPSHRNDMSPSSVSTAHPDSPGNNIPFKLWLRLQHVLTEALKMSFPEPPFLLVITARQKEKDERRYTKGGYSNTIAMSRLLRRTERWLLSVLISSQLCKFYSINQILSSTTLTATPNLVRST